eukprot:3298875-Prymnesium_polylepis.1
MVAVGASIVPKQRAAMRTCVRQRRRPRLSEAGATTEAVVKCVIDGHDWCGVEVISMAICSADQTRALSSRIHSLRLVQSPRRHSRNALGDSTAAVFGRSHAS